MKRPTRDPDYTWGQKSSGARPHDLKFYFYELIVYDAYSEQSGPIFIKNDIVYNVNSYQFMPKIQVAYQAYKAKIEKEIEEILIGDV